MVDEGILVEMSLKGGRYLSVLFFQSDIDEGILLIVRGMSSYKYTRT